MTDKLRSYGVAHRELMPDVIHDDSQYANNRAEQPHEATRVRERGMRKFKSVRQAQSSGLRYKATFLWSQKVKLSIPHSAKTGFVGFGSTSLVDSQNFWVGPRGSW